MTHVFIFNPVAGKPSRIQQARKDLEAFRASSGAPIEIVETQHKGHATELAKQAAEQYNPVRIYACGGDGTINEVVQGIVGHPHVEFGCVPIGSGNDFIKNFNAPDFLDYEKQLTAPSYPVDLILSTGDFGSRYSLNAISLSWDSRVAIEVETFKKIPIIKGSIAYALSVITQLIKKETTVVTVEIDGEVIPEQEYLIGMCANGGFYGGGFHGAPFARLNDGLFELILVEGITRRKVFKLFPIYQRGEHLTKYPEIFDEILTYRQGKQLTMRSKTEKIPVTIDGEGIYTHEIHCQIKEHAIRLIVPGNEGAEVLAEK